MFRAASDDDIEAYSDSVTCFIRKCIDDCDDPESPPPDSIGADRGSF